MKFFVKRLAGLLACAVSISALSGISVPVAMAQTEGQVDEELQLTAERFGIRSSVLDISLSPSGTKIAWIAPGSNHTEVLNVFDLNSDEGIQTIASNTEIIGDMRRCEWATDERLLCEVSGMTRSGDGVLLPFTRMFAINGDGTYPESVSRSRTSRQMRFNQDGGDIVALDVAGSEGSVLLTRNYIEENSMGTRLANTDEGLGVDRLDIVSGRTRSEERPDENASFYLADENGSLRLKARALTDSRGFLTGERVFMVRDPGETSWDRLDDMTLDGRALSGFSPVAVDAQHNVLYAYLSLNGYRSVIEVSLDGGGEARIVASRDDVDVANLIRIGRQRRVVGVSFAAEKRVIQYFDDELKELASSLGEALPSHPLISIAGASSDEKQLLIIASSDTDAGTVYLYDKNTRSLEVLLAMRDDLVDQSMGQLVIVGRSYGGYAALLSQVVDPDLYKAVVAIAPVTDLEFLRDEARAYTNYRFRDRQLGEGPHIAAGSPQRHAERFKAPVALFHGTRDVNVSVCHSREMADALEDEGKAVTYVEFEDLQHGLGDSNARVEMLIEIDRFLAAALGR